MKTQIERADAAPISGTRHVYQSDAMTWIDVVGAEAELVNLIGAEFGLHPLHVEDVTSTRQRPKLDESHEPDYLFLILHYPLYDRTTRLAQVAEIDVLLLSATLISFHDGELTPITRLAAEAKQPESRTALLSGGPGLLLYRLIQALNSECFPLVSELDERLDKVEAQMFTRKTNETVQELSLLRREVISLRRIVKPNLDVLRLLADHHHSFLNVDSEAYFGDLLDGLQRIWDALDEQKEIIEGLDATLFNLASHRINEEMKIFTLISVIMLPMTLLASILGMNVMIPFADHPLALPAAMLLMLIIGIVLYGYFRSRRMI